LIGTVQIFGIRNSNATRAAERFFKERRVEVHFVDLAKKPMSPGEIKRFVDRFGLAGLLDTESKVYADAGLKYLRVAETDMLARIEREPRLLRLPLVRSGNRVSIGPDEMTWKAMLNTTS
jgi:arsenate reductase-like glutaredoxin family protein